MSSETIYYTVYETTNLINGKKYRGAHKTSNPNDSYLGSGYVLLAAIDKYGRENFRKEILFFANSIENMYYIENKLVDKEWILSDCNYNLVIGGRSPMLDKEQIKNLIIQKYETIENYNNINTSKSRKTKFLKYGNENYVNTKKQSETMTTKYGVDNISKVPEKLEETLTKVRETNNERYKVDYPFQNKEIREKGRISAIENGSFKESKNPAARKIKITSPDGKFWISYGTLHKTIEEIKLDYDITYRILTKPLFENYVPRKGKGFGWKIEYID